MKLIAADMDGTLLDVSGKYNHRLFRQVLDLAKQKGVAIAICTGNQGVWTDLQFSEYLDDLWILADGGARMHYRDEITYYSSISEELRKNLLHKILSLPYPLELILSIGEHCYVRKGIDESKTKYILNHFDQPVAIDDLLMIKGDILKFTGFSESRQGQKIVEALSEFNDCLDIVSPEGYWLDITQKDVSKGSILTHLQARLNITKEETVTFGDGRNDLTMFAVAGLNIAPLSGEKEAMEAADFLIASNENDGVLKAMMKLLEMNG
ncbi:MAG: Cof-type HAD-IIB family hydrolase [Erysipelotrichaceae bacterium]|jgi:Cof subfamily protein (haloacid dehalogenase superfamily)|nr:Cof-type HAD-IIB family hydrolase [Erysipelotrichaceae bacterium]